MTMPSSPSRSLLATLLLLAIVLPIAHGQGGACVYDDVQKEGYGRQTAALRSALFNNGQTCGACYEIKCTDNPEWCKPRQPSLIVTATNFCPPNNNLPNDNGGWCNPPLEHFDIAKPVFLNIAEYKAGIVPVTYPRVHAKNKEEFDSQ